MPSALPASYHLSTRAIHTGEDHHPHGAHAAPLYQTSTYVYDELGEYAQIALGEKPGYTYTRINNPTVTLAEQKLAALEGTTLQRAGRPVEAKLFASGMAAISTAILARAQAGDQVLVQDHLYSSTHGFFYEVMPRYGIGLARFDPHVPGALEQALAAHPNIKVVYLETPANPMMKVVDIAQIVAVAHAHQVWVYVDNTFASPICQRPLELGADVALHSSTKYLGGHGVVVSGVLITPHVEFLHDAVGQFVKYVGAAPSPFDCWLLNLGLKTLALRVAQHCVNALAVAQLLTTHPHVARVYYPGLPTDPGHATAQRQMPGGFGGMLSFELSGGYDACAQFVRHLRLARLGVSLGTVDSLIQHPASMTHLFVPPAERQRQGISDGLLRYSVGIEDTADLLDDLTQALNAL